MERIALSAFIKTHGITSTAVRVNSDPQMQDSANMDHWRVTLRNRANRTRMSVPFSMGCGHNGAEPTALGVLSCLADDAAGFENASNFEDWASEYGYDTDSRKAERTFRAVQRSAERLKAFMGDAAYKALLWETEKE